MVLHRFCTAPCCCSCRSELPSSNQHLQPSFCLATVDCWHAACSSLVPSHRCIAEGWLGRCVICGRAASCGTFTSTAAASPCGMLLPIYCVGTVLCLFAQDTETDRVVCTPAKAARAQQLLQPAIVTCLWCTAARHWAVQIWSLSSLQQSGSQWPVRASVNASCPMQPACRGVHCIHVMWLV